MKKSRFSMLVLALVLCVSVFTCGTVFASDTIKIGILGPFTGSLAFNAGEMKKGMMLALDEIKRKGRSLRQKGGNCIWRYRVQTRQRTCSGQKNSSPGTMSLWSVADTAPVSISPPANFASSRNALLLWPSLSVPPSQTGGMTSYFEPAPTAPCSSMV